MKTQEFKLWLKGLEQLSPAQWQGVSQIIQASSQPGAIFPHLEQAATKICPRCANEKLYRWGRQSGLQRYRCASCHKCFNALSGTPLARLRLKGHWLSYSQALIDGLSVRKAARQCGVHRTTSFRWRHRFLAAPAQLKPTEFTGIVEADESYFPLSFKGSRQLGRPAHRRGHAVSEPGTGAEKVPVLVPRDRHKTTAEFKLNSACAAEESPILKERLAKDAVLCSDSAKSLKSAAQQAGITHRPVNLAAGIRVVAGVYHVQNVNAYDSRLKGWMLRFHGVATKYLSNYLAWYRHLDRWGELASPLLFLKTTATVL